MKNYEIYFIGSNRSFVSSIFLNSLIDFTKKNSQFKVKYILDTDPDYGFSQKGIIYSLKNKIKSILYFFLNKKYYYIDKVINNQIYKKKCIFTNAKINSINFGKFSNFDKKIDKNKSILISCGGTKIFKNFFLNKFFICMNYHHAEIPKFRGAFSNSHSLFHNTFYTYFSFHYIKLKIDRGYVFYKRKIKINKKNKNNLFYESLKIKLAAKSIKSILNAALKKKVYKFRELKKGNYYSVEYYKNLFLDLDKFSYKQIQKYIDIFGGIYYMNEFVTGIKKDKKGIKLKDSNIKVTEIKYVPVFLYRLLRLISFIKP